MGAKNLLVLKTHVDGSINISFVNDFVYGNMFWAFRSLWGFISTVVVYFSGLILRYILRFLQLGDAKNEVNVQPPDADSEANGISEKLATFFFWSENFLEVGEERETEIETESSAFMEDNGKSDGETESSVLKKVECDTNKDPAESGIEGEEDGSDFMGSNSSVHEDAEKNVAEEEGFVFMEMDWDPRKCKLDEDEKEFLGLIESNSSVLEGGEKIDESKTEESVFMENGFNTKNREEEKEEETVETNFTTNTRKCEYMCGKDTISGFIEEPTAMSFSFREFYMGPYVSTTISHNSCTDSAKQFSALDSQAEDSVAQGETKDSVQEQGSSTTAPPNPSTSVPFWFESHPFVETDLSDEDNDDFLFNENSIVSDSESESSSSSGLIWGNVDNKVDSDSLTYEFLVGKSIDESFETKIMKLMMQEDRIEGEDAKQSSSDDDDDGFIEMGQVKNDSKSFNIHEEKGWSNDMKKSEAKCKKNLQSNEPDSNFDTNEDDLEWEHDDLVEQLKLELKNARRGGLATIPEEDEGEDEDEKEEEEENEKEELTESPKPKMGFDEDLEQLEVEEKVEYSEQIDEIERVYKSYAEKMKKLDILNYQTMHALGLIQLNKDPLKLISIPKSTTQGAKPVISHNLWPRKGSKNTNDPILKLVHELHRDLELVYVGQVCLSWEILCWQHKKAQELQREHHSHGHRYNLVAGEFQLFQVLLQRFIENEPFQGPRIHNYVKNRCVIRNLLQVPAIKDDSLKDRNMSKVEEEVPITSGRLADIIKECMRVYWEFAGADKDYGNVVLKLSQRIPAELKDPSTSGLIDDMRAQLHKKEKWLKDLVRSGNCIVRKFQKHHQDELDHEQLVAQVGLRLISRVLSMSRLRKEQVLWCNEKLHRIRFLSRKNVQVEPSFSLFPC
ncbi:uncharacterized protein LOC107489396 [Arachis duranensis]|uniref:Uncharacterized protein LOC107489396 n=1 Tax=Arachis duranensis TaxID=130453 RepID=A0A6P4DEA1_ARADU|nr:uncharacterized protein LOC107489396 [Arachis duranensis]